MVAEARAMRCTGALASQLQMLTHHNGGEDEGELAGGDQAEAVYGHQGEGLGEETYSSHVQCTLSQCRYLEDPPVLAR